MEGIQQYNGNTASEIRGYTIGEIIDINKRLYMQITVTQETLLAPMGIQIT